MHYFRAFGLIVKLLSFVRASRVSVETRSDLLPSEITFVAQGDRILGVWFAFEDLAGEVCVFFEDV